MNLLKPMAGISASLGFLLLISFQAGELRAEIKPEEIIEKSIEAQGGRAVLESVKDSVVTASCKIHTPQGEFLAERKVFLKSDPTKMRMEQTLLGMETVIGYDGETAWLQQMGKTMAAPQAIQDSIKASLSREDLLLKYREKGFKVEYLEESRVENSRCHKILFEGPDGEETVYHFDAETHLPLKMEFDGPDETGKIVRSEAINSDFRNVENMMIPFHSVFLADGKTVMETTLRTIEINAGLDDALFSKPDK